MRRLIPSLGAAAVAVAMAVAGTVLVAAPASAASLTEVTNFGTNPSNLRMHLYVPDKVAARPGVLVAIHYCTGTGPGYHSGTQFAQQADRYGFIVIYPSATRSGQCFDVYSQQTLKRGGSDPASIVSMVKYVQQRYNADPSRVFAAGSSSGAMMTNVLLGNYPDVFAGGAAFAGVPHSCFATTGGSTWNSQCANGQVTKTPQQWGDLVRNAYPGYAGPWPRIQLWHGTSDDTLRYPNFNEEIKQWTNVHGLSQTATFTDRPSGSTRTRYGDSGPMAPVEAISIQGGVHNIPVNAAEAIRFFGLNNPSPTTPPTAPPTVPPTTPPTVPPTTPPIPPTQPPTGCTVAYTTSGWSSGFTASVRITNNATTAIDGWTLTFAFGAGQAVTSAWNATVTQSGTQVTARNAAYNGAIPAGGAQSFGFQGTHSGTNPAPEAFSLNGTSCGKG